MRREVAEAGDDTREEPELVGVERARDRAELRVAHEVDQRAVPVEDHPAPLHGAVPVASASAGAASAAGPSSAASWRRRSQIRWW